MSSEIKGVDLNFDSCRVVGTVVTGFEETVNGECKEKLNVIKSYNERGKIIFDVPFNEVKKAVGELRGVDNLYVVGHQFRAPSLIQASEDKCENFIKSIVADVNFKHMLNIWRDVTNFDRCSESQMLTRRIDDAGPPGFLKFRVTCNRAGIKHPFTSMEAAAWFGGKIHDTYHWEVNLKHFDVEIVLWIDDDKVFVMASINPTSLHVRNIKFFGPTTLRPTIAYNMLRYGGLKSGEIICDPMCGGGSIPIEAAASYRNVFTLGGDNHELAWNRTGQNISHQIPALGRIDSFAWDVRCLPLKDDCVDLLVTDLPFGKRSGKKFDNRILYPAALREMARVGKRTTGRAVLLTQDKRSMFSALNSSKHIWNSKRSLSVNIGGLVGTVFLLNRTNR